MAVSVAHAPLAAADLFGDELLFVDLPSVHEESKYRQKVSEAPGWVSVVTAEEIRRFGHRTLVDILDSVPGFFSTHDRVYPAIGVRGFGDPEDFSTRLLLMIDGVRVNDGGLLDTASIGRHFLLNVQMIERVEISRGPGTSLYGSNAITAVINVMTKRGRDFQGVQASSSIGSNDSLDTSLTLGKRLDKGLEFLVSANDYRSDGYAKLYYPEYDFPESNNGVAENIDGETDKNATFKLGNGSLTLHGAFSERTKVDPTGSFGSVFNDPGSTTLDTSYFVNLKFDHFFGNDTEWHSDVYAQRQDYTGKISFESFDDSDVFEFNEFGEPVDEFGEPIQFNEFGEPLDEFGDVIQFNQFGEIIQFNEFGEAIDEFGAVIEFNEFGEELDEFGNVLVRDNAGDETESPTIVAFDETSNTWYGVQSQLTFHQFTDHKLTIGADARYNAEQHRLNYDVEGVYLDDKRSSWNWGIYAQDQYLPRDDLQLFIGLRFDQFGDSVSETTPRLGLVYQPLPASTFKLLYSTAFRAPNVYDLYSENFDTEVIEKNDLKGERIDTYELILEQQFGENWLGIANLFYYELSDLIGFDFESQIDFDGLSNLPGEIITRGIDLAVDGKVTTNINASAGLTYQRTTGRDGSRPPNSPDVIAKIGLLTPIIRERLLAGIDVRYSSQRDNLQGQAVDAFTVTNLTLTAPAVLPGLELGMSIYNLFNTRYAHLGGIGARQDEIPQDDRQWRFNVKYRF